MDEVPQGVVAFGNCVRKCIEDDRWLPTPHFDERIIKTGRMSYPDVFKVIKNGSIYPAKIQPDQFRVKFEYQQKIVIAGCPSKGANDPEHIYNGGKAYLITCYDRDKEWEVDLDKIPLREIVERIVVQRVGPPVEDLSIDELQALIEAKREAAVAKDRERLSRELAEAEAYVARLLKQQAELVHEIAEANARMTTAKRALGFKEPVIVGGSRSVANNEQMERIWNENFHRYYKSNGIKVNVRQLAEDHGLNYGTLLNWARVNHPQRITQYKSGENGNA